MKPSKEFVKPAGVGRVAKTASFYPGQPAKEKQAEWFSFVRACSRAKQEVEERGGDLRLIIIPYPNKSKD